MVVGTPGSAFLYKISDESPYRGWLRVFKINKSTGARVWENIYNFYSGSCIMAGAVSIGDNLYVSCQNDTGLGDHSNYIFKINGETGRREWTYWDVSKLVSDLKVDFSGNVYFCSNALIGADGYSTELVKLNSADGSVLWHYYGYPPPISSSDMNYIHSINLDGAGNVYVGGYQNSVECISKFSSSGSILWKRLGSNANQIDVNSVIVDESIDQDIYLITPNRDSVTTKLYDRDGTLQWAKNILKPGMNFNIVYPKARTGNIFICAGQFSTIFISYSRGGTLHYAIEGGISLVPLATDVDDGGNFYTLLTGFDVSDRNFHIVKLNSVGIIQYDYITAVRSDINGIPMDLPVASLFVDNFLNIFIGIASNPTIDFYKNTIVKYTP
jgi:hypothetical protein